MEQQPHSQILQQWLQAKDKSSLRFWQDPEFRAAYATRMESSSLYYASIVRLDVQECVGELLGSLRPWDSLFDSLEESLKAVADIPRTLAWSSDGRQRAAHAAHRGLTVRVASLGSGPGTDLLAIARILAACPTVACIECVGVDLFSHPLGGLVNCLENLAIQKPQLRIRMQIFSGIEAQLFVWFCRTAGMKFDLVSARHIRAADKLPMFLEAPSLLNHCGRILMLDNLSDSLPQAQHGYLETTRIGLKDKQIFLVHRQRPPNRVQSWITYPPRY